MSSSNSLLSDPDPDFHPLKNPLLIAVLAQELSFPHPYRMKNNVRTRKYQMKMPPTSPPEPNKNLCKMSCLTVVKDLMLDWKKEFFCCLLSYLTFYLMFLNNNYYIANFSKISKIITISKCKSFFKYPLLFYFSLA